MKASTRSRRGVVTLMALGLLLLAAMPAAADPGADLSVTKTDSPDPVVATSNVTYTISVSNAGPDAATDVALSDVTPAGTTFVAFTVPAGWTCTTPGVGATGTVSCTNPSVASGTSAVFTLVVNVDAGTAEGTVISNTASVTSTTVDPDATDNSATATTTVGIAAEACTITGTSASETLTGTTGDDVICGFQGKDTIDGLAGNDIVVGGNGKDVVKGGDGNDTVAGGNGKDQVVGGAGLDVLRGGNGRDTLDARDGAEGSTLTGGDTLDGGQGRDTCLVDEGDTATDCP